MVCLLSSAVSSDISEERRRDINEGINEIFAEVAQQVNAAELKLTNTDYLRLNLERKAKRISQKNEEDPTLFE